MTMSDPIADMLTRIRNANTAKHDTVDIPASKMKLAIASILLDEGYIKKYVAVVDPIKAGNGIMVLCNVRLKHHSKEFSRQFTSVIADIDEVVECFNTSGDYDYQLKIYARSMQDYQNFVLGTLGDLDCIGSLHSIFVIGLYQSFH